MYIIKGNPEGRLSVPLPLRIDEGKGEYDERGLRPLSLRTPLLNTGGLKEKEKQKRGADAPQYDGAFKRGENPSFFTLPLLLTNSSKGRRTQGDRSQLKNKAGGKLTLLTIMPNIATLNPMGEYIQP